MENHPLLRDVLPDFAVELAALLRSEGFDALAGTVPTLRILSPHDCGDYFCASFRIASSGTWMDRHTVELSPARGMVIVDLRNPGDGETISFVVVLYRPDVREPLLEYFRRR
jgi:hypothetical protein